MIKIALGEALGTFILVFIGCSSVALELLNIHLLGWQIALIWGIAVYLGIIVSRGWCYSHLNPAVSLGFFVYRKISFRCTLFSVLGQLIGAFLAAVLVYLIFENFILLFEEKNAVLRGSSASIRSAMIFGEFYPNPRNLELTSLSTFWAFCLEAFGTSVLILVILILSDRFFHRGITPILIALTVSLLIVFIAPYTQAGLNPARDLMPRIFSALSGWGMVVFRDSQWGCVLVYVLAPLFSAGICAWGYKRITKKNQTIVERAMPNSKISGMEM